MVYNNYGNSNYNSAGADVAQQGNSMPPEMHQAMMAPMVEGSDGLLTPENLKYMLGSNELMDDLERMLRGLEFDTLTGTYVSKNDPLVNDKGVREIMCRINPYLSREIKLSNIDSEMIPRIIKIISHNLAVDIFLRHHEWGINKLNCNFVYNSIIDLIYASYCRGGDAHEKRFLRSTQYGLFQLPMSSGSGKGYNNNRGSFMSKFSMFKKRRY